MLKKIFHLLLAFLILLGGSGMTISKHYCGTNLKSIEIITHSANCCDMPMNCCHNVSLSLKRTDNFIPATSLQTTTDWGTILFNTVETPTFSIFLSFTEKIYTDPSPPKLDVILAKNQTYLL
jgi:hypothetical protein